MYASAFWMSVTHHWNLIYMKYNFISYTLLLPPSLHLWPSYHWSSDHGLESLVQSAGSASTISIIKYLNTKISTHRFACFGTTASTVEVLGTWNGGRMFLGIAHTPTKLLGDPWDIHWEMWELNDQRCRYTSTFHGVVALTLFMVRRKCLQMRWISSMSLA